MDLQVPTRFHDRIARAVARSDPVSVKLDHPSTPRIGCMLLESEGEDTRSCCTWEKRYDATS